MNSSNPFSWWWSRAGDQERGYGPFNCRDDAITDAGERDESIVVFEANKAALRDDIFDANDVLGRWVELNQDVANDDGELGMEPTAEQDRDLERALGEALAAWRERHELGEAWAFGEIRNSETIEPPTNPTEEGYK